MEAAWFEGSFKLRHIQIEAANAYSSSSWLSPLITQLTLSRSCNLFVHNPPEPTHSLCTNKLYSSQTNSLQLSSIHKSPVCTQRTPSLPPQPSSHKKKNFSSPFFIYSTLSFHCTLRLIWCCTLHSAQTAANQKGISQSPTPARHSQMTPSPDDAYCSASEEEVFLSQQPSIGSTSWGSRKNDYADDQTASEAEGEDADLILQEALQAQNAQLESLTEADLPICKVSTSSELQ